MRDVEFWKGLERRGDAVAIDRGGDAPISYARLVELADAFAAQLPSDRQLVALQARNEVESIVAYVACLRHRHPVIILNEESIVDGRILTEYEPNWLYTNQDGSWCLKHLTDRADTMFAEELAVMLSTSGTTGAPKLVKLSYDNIASNADAIAEYLRLTPDDCAITTLDFCYSYGMSVLNSYLSVGARILLTDESVVSKRFWSLFESRRATSLALVPSHFDLLDRIDFGNTDLPTLRYITQAGGKLHADKIKRYARIARDKGWLFYVMYGQTEASPRISYVPPDELLANVDSIGKAIPGGELVLIGENGFEVAGTGQTGELVYRGPNVMLGYAECRADLAKPRDTVALRTGDMAQRQENGYFKIVGRLSRFIKLYGLRINLDEIEGQLRHAGYQVYCTGNDQTLALFYTDSLDEAALKAFIHERYKVQTSHIFLMKLADVPLLSSGKVNYRALSALIAPEKSNTTSKLSVRSMFAEALGNKIPLRDTDSFTSIGGDSLSYLNISLQLEEALGYLPEEWERMSIHELELLRPTRSALMWLPVETIVRNVAIFSVVANHLVDAKLDGGAIVLILLVGYSLAKYDGDRLPSSRLVNFFWSKLSRILVLYYFIVFSYFIATWGQYSLADALPWLLLVPNYDELSTSLYAYWFIGAYAQLVLLVAAVWQLPAIRRIFSERKTSFGYVALLVGFVIALIAERETPASLLYRNTFAIFHVCMLGWCAFFAKSLQEKAIVSACAVLSVILFWSNPNVEWKPIYFDLFFLAGCLSVTWLGRVPVPRAIGSFLMWMASISFYIYIMHMIIVYIVLEDFSIKLYTDWREKLLAGIVITVVGYLLSVILAALAARFMALIEGRIRRFWTDRQPPSGAARPGEQSA
jgi:acyl-CoA synthetase (AMP-forming)/AMP-acid ligase II